MEMENPSRTAFVTIVEVNGQTFAPGVARNLIVNSQSSGTNPASMSSLNCFYVYLTIISLLPAGGPGGDFVNVVNQLLPIGGTTSSFGYQLIDDNVVETTETFQLVLSPGTGDPVDVLPAGSTATILILENDSELFVDYFLIKLSWNGSIYEFLIHTWHRRHGYR